MYIVTSDGKQIVSSEYVERFLIVDKPDAKLIVASYSDQRPAVTLGRYANDKESQGAFGQLLSALAGGQSMFYMPDSILYHGEKIIKDARTKRKGGS